VERAPTFAAGCSLSCEVFRDTGEHEEMDGCKILFEDFLNFETRILKSSSSFQLPWNLGGSGAMHKIAQKSRRFSSKECSFFFVFLENGKEAVRRRDPDVSITYLRLSFSFMRSSTLGFSHIQIIFSESRGSIG
jgi:hypothetical protein